MTQTRLYLRTFSFSLAIFFAQNVYSWGNSFSFGDSWNSGNSGTSWSTPDWGGSYYSPNWGGQRYYYPPPGYYYPRMSPYDRTQMKEQRQRLMSGHASAMDSLSDMLNGRFRFDRENAISMATEIRDNAGDKLASKFHPGAVATHGSNTAPSYWGNEENFRKNALSLSTAADVLIKELQRKPTKDEPVVYPRNNRGFDYRLRDGVVADPVPNTVFQRFNELGAICSTCHFQFRIPKN